MYPPPHHTETDMEKIFKVMDTFPFATMISAGEEQTLVSQLPLLLRRNKGAKGMLVGHMDRNNPHAEYLDEEPCTVIFNGPNAYISPRVYASSQLPTWNYISVHVRGTVHRDRSPDSVKQSMILMTRQLEPDENPYVLEEDDPRMDSLIPYVAGFEIEIEEMIGRFKLSQDKKSRDTRLAKDHLVSESGKGHKELIDFLL